MSDPFLLLLLYSLFLLINYSCGYTHRRFKSLTTYLLLLLYVIRRLKRCCILVWGLEKHFFITSFSYTVSNFSCIILLIDWSNWCGASGSTHLSRVDRPVPPAFTPACSTLVRPKYFQGAHLIMKMHHKLLEPVCCYKGHLPLYEVCILTHILKGIDFILSEMLSPSRIINGSVMLYIQGSDISKARDRLRFNDTLVRKIIVAVPRNLCKPFLHGLTSIHEMHLIL